MRTLGKRLRKAAPSALSLHEVQEIVVPCDKIVRARCYREIDVSAHHPGRGDR